VADRAAAYGMPGVVLDGMDVEAVHEAAGAAIGRARQGAGPTLIECQTYRMVGHSRTDPRNYRSSEEEAAWQARDPIPHLAQRLKEMGLATDDTLATFEEEVAAEIEDAVSFAEASPYPEPIDTLKHVFYTSEQG
jgi:TPP-dependent pyruvate/acetoin dehydrogenase alpha subunit